MTEEAELKTKLVTQCKKLGAYARRFEDRYAVGILDVLVAFPDMPVCFVEGKILRSNAISPTERQWVEGDKLCKLRGGFTVPLLVGWDANKVMYVGEWARKLPLQACLMQKHGNNYAETLWSFINDKQLRGRFAIGRSEEVGVQ